ncbi:hypothetical protein B9G55_13025 [Saccharibacillus sp. O16]|nr:hypothetical protein B9G55_13025 [Saccharibacillus sp. O16]
MRKRFSLFVFILCFIMLLPTATSATDVNGANPNGEFTEDVGRVVTEEEFKLISDTLVAQRKNDPTITAEEVVEQLGLQNVKIFYEKDFENQKRDLNEEFTTMSVVDEPHVGFADPTRTKTQVGAYCTAVINDPTHLVDEYQANIYGYSKLPGGQVGDGYTITHKQEGLRYLDLKPGVTRLGGKAVVSHFDNKAKIRINAVIKDGGLYKPRYAILEWDENGRYTIFTSNPLQPT